VTDIGEPPERRARMCHGFTAGAVVLGILALCGSLFATFRTPSIVAGALGIGSGVAGMFGARRAIALLGIALSVAGIVTAFLPGSDEPPEATIAPAHRDGGLALPQGGHAVPEWGTRSTEAGDSRGGVRKSSGIRVRGGRWRRSAGASRRRPFRRAR
jgi:hypothetical protein